MFARIWRWIKNLFTKKKPTQTSPRTEPVPTPQPIPTEPDVFRKNPYYDEYKQLILTMEERSDKKGVIDWHMNFWERNKELYQKITDQTGVPAEVIFCIHGLECSFRMDAVLHNGQRIIGTGKKTTWVPRGKGPFDTWEEAALDALEHDGLTKVKDWDGPNALYELEAYNGWGYRKYRDILSPYLWSFSNHYTKGKYVSDGRYDRNAVSKQCGAALLLNRLGYLKKFN
jgi:lysozyme family protein